MVFTEGTPWTSSPLTPRGSWMLHRNQAIFLPHLLLTLWESSFTSYPQTSNISLLGSSADDLSSYSNEKTEGIGGECVPSPNTPYASPSPLTSPRSLNCPCRRVFHFQPPSFWIHWKHLTRMSTAVLKEEIWMRIKREPTDVTYTSVRD